MTEDDLVLLSRMVTSAGLIKVWDGSAWADLRVKMNYAINEHQKLLQKLDEIEQFCEELKAENDHLKLLLFADE